MPTAALIVNGKSRRGREWYPQVLAKLREEGFELTETNLLRDPKLLDEHVKRAIKAKTPLVCVGGGDGTLSGACGLFVGSESTLGVLPLGTGNSLARDLGIKVDVNEACKVLTDGVVREIDLGVINDQRFVNVATIGLTTRIAESLDNEAKKKWGRMVYLTAIFKAVAKVKQFEVDLELPSGKQCMQAVQVVVGNGRFHGGPFPILPDAEIESGKLAGYVLTSLERGTLLRYGLSLVVGHHSDMKEVVPFEVKTLNIKTVPVKRITVDGETRLTTPAEFSVLHRAIRVMTPAETPSRRVFDVIEKRIEEIRERTQKKSETP